jgi:hypothetical protein
MSLGFVPRDAAAPLTLTEEQIEAVRRLAVSDRAVLDGATGSGKTHLAATVATGYARRGRRVLILSPRKPLANWLQRALQGFGVSVLTIGEAAGELLRATGRPSPVRREFEDVEYFVAAAALARPDRWDLVIGEEWQTAGANERLFVEALVGGGRFIEVRDSSRELEGDVHVAPSGSLRVELTQRHRGGEALQRLDMAYVDSSYECPRPSDLADAVSVTEVECGQDEPQKAVLDLLDALRRRGIAPGEVGVATALGRSQSSLLEALRTGPQRWHAMRLTDPWSLSHIACDSFAYWLGLERRVMVVVEAPQGVPSRRRRIHTAVSRACEEVHFLMPKLDLDSDEVLSAWLLRDQEAPSTAP